MKLVIVAAVIAAVIFAIIESGVFDPASDAPESAPADSAEAERPEPADPASRSAPSQVDDRRPPEAVAVPAAECPLASELADLESAAESPVYIVKPGDTMSAIARQIGISIYELIALNPEADPDLIHVGDALRIGAGTTPVPERRPRAGIEPDELADLQHLVLYLVNDARQAEGLRPVALGANPAAQGHAEDMAARCFLSHWGSDGMKPYMRYSLAGGVQANAENVSGSSFCPADPSRYIQKPLAEEAREAFERLMDSRGHRANILRPEHRVLHLGMAYRAPNLWLVQHFSGHYAAFAQLPEIENGRLSFDMSACNGARVAGDDLGVQVRYDPLPAPLATGQLQRTACYSSGRAIAGLRPPLGPNQFYTDRVFTLPAGGCLEPRSINPDLPVARSYEEASSLKLPARSTQSLMDESGIWITAGLWEVENSRVRVDADVKALLGAAGSGVYTILIWGSIDGESVPIAEYPIIED